MPGAMGEGIQGLCGAAANQGRIRDNDSIGKPWETSLISSTSGRTSTSQRRKMRRVRRVP